MRGVSGLNQVSASLSCLLTRIAAAAETSAPTQMVWLSQKRFKLASRPLASR